MRDQINEYTTTAAENFTTNSDRVLDAIVDGNQRAVDAWVKTADQVNEQLPEVEILSSLPTPTEAGQNYMEWVEKAVDANRDFNHRVAEMITADPSETVKEASDKATKAAKETQDRVTGAVKDATGSVSKAVKDASDRVTSTVSPAPRQKATPAKKAATKKATTAKKAATKKTATAKKTVAKKTATA